MDPKPPKCVFLNDNDKEELIKHYSARNSGWCQVGESKTLVPYTYAIHAENIWRAEIRPSDRWIVTYPRSGTTWVQELVWLINNDLDYEGAAKYYIAERFYFLEFGLLAPDSNATVDDNNTPSKKCSRTLVRPSIGEILKSIPSPRFMKTHSPLELLPPDILDVGCKVIYVARNPKDVAVSFYHMETSRKMSRYIGDFPSFWNFFMRDLKIWCPYWSHVKQAWNLRHHPNLLFLFYEDMKHDLPGVIRRVGDFYGRPCTDDEIGKLARHLDFDSFKSNPMIGSPKSNGQDIMSKDMFVRKGKVGGWRELFTPDLEAQADKWIEENLRDTDLVFPHL